MHRFCKNITSCGEFVQLFTYEVNVIPVILCIWVLECVSARLIYIALFDLIPLIFNQMKHFSGDICVSGCKINVTPHTTNALITDWQPKTQCYECKFLFYLKRVLLIFTSDLQLYFSALF